MAYTAKDYSALIGLPGFSETLLPLLEPALDEVLGALAFLGSYPLRYVRQVEKVEE